MTEYTRDEIAEKYLETIPYSLYPVQEEALLAWFSSEQGVLVCAPTGTGKTLIAEAAVYEALVTGRRCYYTTPLIALTDQKFRELQESAERWGFSADDVGLVTGNHKVNPGAKVLVVVAEILFNRLLHPEEFDDFQDVQSVVMDEFHNFNDPERGIVWEFSLALLPQHVRLLLLSATVGNAVQFANWLDYEHHHRLEVVQSDDRKVPLEFRWVGDQTLVEQIQWMCLGKEEERMTPSLVFCFNRDECWRVAEEIRGKELIPPETKSKLVAELSRFDWTQGAGPKLKQLLMRGVGVHHAGILPKYRRIIEYLFQQKLLAVCTCTETLSAGINLPARSVVLPSIMKGPAGKQTLLDPGSAHQIFGRAGRPQFDSHGYVFAVAPEDDVMILRWQEKFNRLPADSKDPKILAEKKALKKKQPKRNPNLQYWTEQQFMKLKNAPAGNLESHGLVPWRLLAYMLKASPEVTQLRELVKKRLLFGRRLENAQKDLDRMLGTLWSGGFVSLDPLPPTEWFPSLPRPEQKSTGVTGMTEPEIKPEIKPEIETVTEPENTENAEKTAVILQNSNAKSKATPSLEMWKATRGKSADAPTIKVPPVAKKHVAKPKQTGFGAGILDDFPDGTVTEPEKTTTRTISLLDFGKKSENGKKNSGENERENGFGSAKKADAGAFHYEKSSSGFGMGLLDDDMPEATETVKEPEIVKEAEPQKEPKKEPEVAKEEPEMPVGNLLAGLTLGGGISQPTRSRDVKGGKKSEDKPEAKSKTEPKAEVKAEVKAENKTESKMEVKPESKPAYIFVNGAAVLAPKTTENEEEKPIYIPQRAIPEEALESMAKLRGVHPIYGTWLLNYLPHADRKERLQAFESILELPYSLGPAIRVPYQEDLPRGRLAVGYLDTRLLDLGLAVEAELVALTPQERKERREAGLEPIFTLTLADKLYRLFQHEFPLVSDLRVWPCWVAGELLRFNGKFNTYISGKSLQKQEGMIFRHLLRLILLLGEFIEMDLPTGNADEWKTDLSEVVELLTKSCEAADPSGTRQMLEDARRI